MAMFCSYCGTAIQDDAKFCNGCGKPIAFSPAPSELSQSPANQNITVVVKNKSKTPIFSLFGICCGILGIFTLGFIFVPLGLLFTLIGLLRGEFLVGAISAVVNVFGLLTSPVLVALLGIGAIVGSSALTNHSPAEKRNEARIETADAPATTSTTSGMAGTRVQKQITVLRWSETEHETERKIVEGLFAEELARAQSESGPTATIIKVATIDLNDDGKAEIIAQLTHEFFCGMHGCDLEILSAKPDGEWKKIGQWIADIELLEIHTAQRNGYKTISFGEGTPEWWFENGAYTTSK